MFDGEIARQQAMAEAGARERCVAQDNPDKPPGAHSTMNTNSRPE